MLKNENKSEHHTRQNIHNKNIKYNKLRTYMEAELIELHEVVCMFTDLLNKEL